MTNIDQFESVFKAAAKTLYVYKPVQIRSVLVVTDLPQPAADQYADHARRALSVPADRQPLVLRVVLGSEYRTVGELLKLVESESPDLICTYRNLHSTAWRWPYSLGVHLDVLTQATEIPVLVLPHPEDGADLAAAEPTQAVMAIADHLTGDHHLVDYSAMMTPPGGTLYLTHVEDQAAFDRYMEVISKLPEIDTDLARQAIAEQLLAEPRDYIDSCRAVLTEHEVPITVEPIVTMGHHLIQYKRLIESHQVGLLVINTKDEDQLAMHGLAYPLSVELRRTPLLML